MLDEVIGIRQLMTLWGDLKSHMLASYRTCFVNILKVCSAMGCCDASGSIYLTYDCMFVPIKGCLLELWCS